jgi:hypothetical protein
MKPLGCISNGEKSSNLNEPIFDIAHLAHVELLTPSPKGMLWYFKGCARRCQIPSGVTEGFFLAVGGDPNRRNGANPTARRVKRLDCIGVVDRDFPVRLDDGAAPVAVNPFQCVAGDAFAGPALENETVKILFACRAFALLYFSGDVKSVLVVAQRAMVRLQFWPPKALVTTFI